MFLGRQKELNQLLNIINSPKLEVVLIYGRRRVGKTALIKELLSRSKIPFIYYEASRTNRWLNESAFLTTFKLTFKSSKSNSIFNAIDEIFLYSTSKPIILALDEFSFLDQNIPEVLGYLQQKIDTSENSKIKIILSGSYIETMKSLTNYDSPLHGRITSSLYLKAFDYFESSIFYSNLSNIDKFEFYACFGGLPLSLIRIDPAKSLKENILNLFLNDGNYLKTEIDKGLVGEFKKLENADIVFKEIVNGNNKRNSLLKSTRLPSASLDVILKTLVNMNLLSKKTPINDENNKKKTFYEIHDFLLNFYYTFIFQNQSIISILDKEEFYYKFIEEILKREYLPKMFEKVSKEFLIRMNKSRKLKKSFYKIGSYWYDDPKSHRNGEFDVATLDEDGYCIYECKYRKNPIDDEIIYEEKKQTAFLPLGSVKLGFISKNGFQIENSSILNNVNLFSLDDFYNI